MSHFDLIRGQARMFRRQICGEESDALVSAEQLLDKVETFTRVRRLGLEKGDPLLCGALAILDENRIYFDKTLEKKFALYCQTHEYAHLHLHGDSTHCTPEEINFSVSETEAFDAESRVLGYGQSERLEREANVFAAEFLLPCSLAMSAFRQKNLKAKAIAEAVGLPLKLVYSQLAQSLIEVQSSKCKVQSESEFQTLNFKFENESQSEIRNLKSEIGRDQSPKTEDQTQTNASQTEICPTLLEAAPGTGKTRTLIERVCFLLKKKAVAPESILALTFSNKAAEEMRERIGGAVDKETAAKIYITTFHAFGLEILRKYHNAANLTANAPVIDRITAVELLEEKLLSLQLKHFQNLREPLENLPKILSTISRAKDELVSAEDFQKLSEAQFAGAETPVERETAEKCLETARVYRIYDGILRKRNLLDYGDLIFRSVCLLRENAAIREAINEEFRHVLVDEYQDVNRAGAEFLRLVSNNGKGVWAVGDARQAIYRWRGAATARNIRDFAKDFPEAQSLYLGKNYRSRPHIVAAVSTFAKELNEPETEESFTDWQAHRNEENGEIRFAVTENLTEEAAWMAERMRELQAKGTAWREQAVIARTHKTLQRVAEELEKHKIPFVYIGNWLESDAMRDLISWLAFAGGGDKYAIVRVANFADYQIPFADIQRVVRCAVENKCATVEAVRSLSKSEDFSDATKNGFLRLLEDYDSIPAENTIWTILANYLFENGSYLDDAEDGFSAQTPLVLYQLLQLAQAFDQKTEAKKLPREIVITEFLRYVRRLKMFGEEQALQQLPVSLAATDAVRLLTIHASKGLEFEAVFVPHLGARFYPKSGKGNLCPLPEGITDSDEKVEHAQEEKCLFFVAISRARQFLCLSRSTHYGKQPSNASPFLKALATHLPFSPESGATWHSRNFQPETDEKIESRSEDENCSPSEFYLRELEDYDICPRRYFYQNNLPREKSSGAIYLEFHRCLHAALNFGLDEAAAKRSTSLEKLREIFQDKWMQSTHSTHAYAELYQTEAEEILQNIFSLLSADSGESSFLRRGKHYFDLPNGRVLFAPSFTRQSKNADGETRILVEHWRSGKLRKKESDETLYQLAHEAARQHLNGGEVEVKVSSLKNSEEIFVPRKLKRGREIAVEEKFSALIKAIDGIKRRNFSPKPHENCSSCQFYFICLRGD